MRASCRANGDGARVSSARAYPYTYSFSTIFFDEALFPDFAGDGRATLPLEQLLEFVSEVATATRAAAGADGGESDQADAPLTPGSFVALWHALRVASMTPTADARTRTGAHTQVGRERHLLADTSSAATAALGALTLRAVDPYRI